MSKSLIYKRFLGKLLKPIFSLTRKRRVILIYHDIAEEGWAVSHNNFKQQMAWLAKHATVVSLSELINGKYDYGLNVAITFDDGYDSVFKIALPEMNRYAFKGTVFLNTHMISDSKNRSAIPSEGHYPNAIFMNWNQVEKLRDSYWNIGSHGVNHYDLTLVNAEKKKYELCNSKLNIEEKLGISCCDFSYTWGNYNDELIEQVKSSGYSSAVSGEFGPLLTESDQFVLPRIDIRSEYDINDFSAIIQGRWDYLKIIQSMRNR